MTPAESISTLLRRRDFWPVLRHLLGNTWRMTLLWVLFGVEVGMLTTPPPRGPISLCAYALAGIIVLAPLGALAGLLGARPRDALVMAVLGAAAGTLVGAGLRLPGLGYTAAVGLITGTLVGTSFVTLFYRLPRLVLHLVAVRS